MIYLKLSQNSNNLGKLFLTSVADILKKSWELITWQHLVSQIRQTKNCLAHFDGTQQMMSKSNLHREPINLYILYSSLCVNRTQDQINSGQSPSFMPNSNGKSPSHITFRRTIIYRGVLDRKSTRLNSSHMSEHRMPSSA